VRALKGSELIIHAGDVGEPDILDELNSLAPVIAVRGNIDRGAWALKLPLTAVAETAHATIYVLHDVHELDPKASGFQIVVSGHSHKPGRMERNGVLYVNPGSAGPRRFQLPVTVARLDLSQKTWSVAFIELSSAASS
jgi:putative phosphoesterase